jgi:peptidoglycan/LPS O-acetylase OafA/YrhL
VRVPALDGLRAFAAFLVALSHFSNQTGFLGGWLGARGGQLGVMIFFLISGFLMARLYAGAPCDAAHVADFLRKRVARVVPLYLLVVALSAAAFRAFGGASPLFAIDGDRLMDHLLFRDGVSVLWTIPVEIHFYLLFPLLWWLAARAGPRWTVAILLAAAFGGFWFLTRRFPFQTLPHHLHYFLLGVVAGIAAPRDAAGSRPAWDAIFLLTVAGTFLIMPRIFEALSGVKLGGLWRSPVPLAVLTLLLWSCLRSPLAERLLGGGLGRFFGDISYSVYLLHLPALRVLSSVEFLGERSGLLCVAFFSTLTALGYLSFRLFEAPARRWINALPLGRR